MVTLGALKYERNALVLQGRRAGASYGALSKRFGVSRERIIALCQRPEKIKAERQTGPQPKYYSHIRWQAKRRGKTFSITREFYNEIVKLPCVYGGGTQATGIRIGVDRLDNAIGYLEENCAPCCFRHNQIRSNVFTRLEFMDAVQRYPGLKACGNMGSKTRLL